jgi:GNAT superfamily N-acetyltransferase
MIAVGHAETAEDIDKSAHLIAKAFDILPANHYLVSDPQWRLPVMQDWLRLHVEHAAQLGVGRVMITTDLSAVAVWFRRTITVTEPHNYDKRLADTVGEYLPRFQELDRLLDANHPTEPPHWYLAFAAVHPDQQGKGIGTALLTHTLDWLDRHDTPTYLEAASDRSAALYRRLGYLDMGTPLLLGDGTPFYPMWRPAAEPGQAA